MEVEHVTYINNNCQYQGYAKTDKNIKQNKMSLTIQCIGTEDVNVLDLVIEQNIFSHKTSHVPVYESSYISK